MATTTHVLTHLDPCPLIGRPCAVAQGLIDALALAMIRADDLVGEGFCLTGTVETRACGRICQLRWSGTAQAIDVAFSGPETGPDTGPLSGPVLRAERLQGWLA